MILEGLSLKINLTLGSFRNIPETFRVTSCFLELREEHFDFFLVYKMIPRTFQGFSARTRDKSTFLIFSHRMVDRWNIASQS